MHDVDGALDRRAARRAAAATRRSHARRCRSGLGSGAGRLRQCSRRRRHAAHPCGTPAWPGSCASACAARRQARSMASGSAARSALRSKRRAWAARRAGSNRAPACIRAGDRAPRVPPRRWGRRTARPSRPARTMSAAPPSLAGHHRLAGGQRLDHHHPEVVDARVQQRPAARVELFQRAASLDPAEERDVGAGQALEPRAVGPSPTTTSRSGRPAKARTARSTRLLGTSAETTSSGASRRAGGGRRSLAGALEAGGVDGRRDDLGVALVVATDAVARVAAVGDHQVRAARGAVVPAPQVVGQAAEQPAAQRARRGRSPRRPAAPRARSAWASARRRRAGRPDGASAPRPRSGCWRSPARSRSSRKDSMARGKSGSSARKRPPSSGARAIDR